MISSALSNRMIFVLSLLGLIISSFLFYEYNFSGSVVCPTGAGCDIVRTSPYSNFFGISIPILGIIFYLVMSILSVVYSYNISKRQVRRLQLAITLVGVSFGVYLTYLEAFVIGAFCFWCVLSFIISLMILLAIFIARKSN